MVILFSILLIFGGHGRSNFTFDVGALTKTAFVGTSCYAAATDAATDGYRWGQGKTYHWINENNWHSIKTQSKTAYGAAGFILAFDIAQKRIKLRTGIKRLVGALIINSLVWDVTYHWVRYDKPFDYSPEHNRHAIVYWSWGGDDKYIGLNEYTRPIWDISRAVVGTWLIGRN